MKLRWLNVSSVVIFFLWGAFLFCSEAQVVLTNTLPSNGARDVARDMSVEFQVDVGLNTSLVTTNRFYLYGGMKGRYPGTISFTTSKQATLNPAQDFFPGEQVFAQVTTGIVSSGSGSILPPYAWSFYAHAGVGGAKGWLYDTGQRLGSALYTACVIGDFDGDGDLDAVASLYTSTEGYAVYTNDGAGRFTQAQRFNTPWNMYPPQLTSGDIDNDGDLDVVAALQNGCRILLNDGTGHFSYEELRDIGSGDVTRSVALGDMNGDGTLDAVLANYGQSDEVWTNQNGTFYWAQSFNSALESTYLRLADINHDGSLDVFVSYSYSASIVYTNDGAGVLSEHMTLSPTHTCASLALGDLNGDGAVDAFCGGQNSSKQVWTNNGAGDFSREALYSSAWDYSTELGDVDGDGDLDAVLLEHPFGLQIYTNDGTGTFGNNGMPSNNVGYGCSWASARLGDLDGDDDLDVFMAYGSNCYVYLNELPGLSVLGTNGAVIANGESASASKGTDFAPVVLGNSVMHTLSLTALNAVGVTITNVTTNGTGTAMFSVEGVDDFVAAGGVSNFYIRFTPTSLGVHTAMVSIVHDGTNSPYSFYISGRGTQPLVTNTTPANAAFNQDRAVQPMAQFTQPMNGATLTSNRFRVYSAQAGFQRGSITFNAATNAATLELDADLLVGELVHAELSGGIMNSLNNAELIHHTWSFYTDVQTGPGLFGDSEQLIGPYDTQSAALGDLNNDGWLDVFLVNADQAGEVWTNNGAGVFSKVPVVIGTANSRFVALGDINNDGDLDAVVVRDGLAAQVFNNLGNGIFADSGQALSAGNGRHATLADFNGDGALDILLLRQGEAGAVWTNNGLGVFGLYAATPSAAAMGSGVVDVNGDGFLDAFIADDGSGNLVLTNDGSGKLTASAQLPGSGNSRDVAMGDFNGDGFFDAYVANGSGQANTVWFNSGTGTFYNSGQSLGSASSHGVAAGDYDGDGDLDVFVANYGEPNTIWLNDGAGVFSDSGRRLGNVDSCRVQVGDVDGDDRLDAFVANENGTCTLWLNPRPYIEVFGTNGLLITNGAVASGVAGTDFGTVEFGQSVLHQLSISNPGIVDLVIESISTTATNQVYFSVEEAPVRISSRTASNLIIRFQPWVAGESDAALSIVSTATNSPYRVNLRGMATASFWVTNVEPSGATAIGATTSTAIAWMNDTALAGTLTTNRFLMIGDGNGYHDGVLSLSDGNRCVQLDSEDDFLTGEEITAWFTRGILNGAGLHELYPYAWMYRLAVPGGSAQFCDSGQLLAHTTNQVAALGDIDGDGDLDVIAGGEEMGTCAAWINDGAGLLTKGFEFPGIYDLQGIAFGDLDRDGDQDVFFAYYAFAPITNNVWLNDGSGSYSNAGYSHSILGMTDVVLQDLNADGYLDAFLLVSGGSRVWLNDGGTLVDSGQSLYPGSGMAAKLGMADLDADGDIDAYESKRNGDHVWLNRGDGFFSDGGGHTNQEMFAPSAGLSLGDVDGDGDVDAFSMTFTNAVLWLNNGRAVFTNSGQLFDCCYAGIDAAMGDLDADGDLDIFYTSYDGYNAVLTNDGAGIFTELLPVMGATNYSVVLGDMDGDGDLDAYATTREKGYDTLWINENPDFAVCGVNGAAITNGESVSSAKGTDFGVVSNATTLAHVFSITNAGPGTFAIMAVLTNGVGAGHFHCVDMPTHIEAGTVSNFTVTFAPLPSVWGTHKANLVIENLGRDDKQMVLCLEGYGLPPSVSNTIPLNAACSVARASNITAQFSEPMLAGTLTSNTFVLHSGQSGFRQGVVNLSPGAQTAVLDPSMPLRPGELVFGSLPKAMTNQPGRALLRPFAWSFYAAADEAPGAFRSSAQVLGSAPTRSVALGDLDGDGDLDALAGNNGAASRAWFNDGSGVFTQGIQALTSAYTYDVAMGDLDLDGDIDVFQVNYNQADRVWLNNGDGTFTDSGQALGSSRSRAVALGDVDGDGDLDAFVGQWMQAAQLWLNDGRANFIASGQTLGTVLCNDVAFGDLNRDGFLDVFLGLLGPNAVWTNNGYGLFCDCEQDLGDAETYGVALGDVDHDGDLDAYAANYGGPHILWLNDGDGHFSDSGQSLGSSFGTDAAFGDVNGDGDLDLVLASDWQQAAEVWTNSGAGLFYNSGQALGNQSRYAVALGDLDDDGDIDAFFGNNGSCDAWFNDVVFYTLTGVAGAHGSITPEGPVTVAAGGSTSFVAYADTYYWIDAMTVAGSARVEAARMKGYTCLCESVYCDATAMVFFAEALAAHGTPELWLVQYGWTNNFDYWEIQDTDGDDFQAWEEQVAGTDPTNAASYLQLTGCESLGNGKMLNWSGVSGRVYSILVNTNLLLSGPWSAISSNLPPTGTWTDTTDHVEADLFYRLGVEQAP